MAYHDASALRWQHVWMGLGWVSRSLGLAWGQNMAAGSFAAASFITFGRSESKHDRLL